jgi:hypothetical protein
MKKLIPLFVLLVLVLSSLACGGGGDIITTGTSVTDNANTVTEVLDSSMLEDANNALLDAVSDLDTLSCETGVSAESMCK